MNRQGWLVFVLTGFWCLHGQAAEKPSPANRANLYQREARAVLAEQNWHVSRDVNGKLVADHPIAVLGASSSGKLELTKGPVTAQSLLHAAAWLTLTFQPESLKRTKCRANILAYSFWDGFKPQGKKRLEPVPFNNPETTKDIQEMMITAERAMVAKHPEYAAN